MITALVYLSVAQEKKLKYDMLQEATYLLFSTPNMDSQGWPIKDELIRTLYMNTESQKPQLDIPKRLRVPIGTDGSEAI